MMSMMGWGFIFNTILWILIVGLVIYAVLSILVKAFEKKEEPAIQILKERYARGEISEEEFARKVEFLKKK